MTYYLFFGASWCGPCHVVEPIVSKIATKSKLLLSVFDLDTCFDDAVTYHITTVPTLIKMDDTGEVGRLVGLQSKYELEKFMK